MERENNLITVSFRLDKDIVVKLDRIALNKGGGYSRTTILNDAISQYLKTHKV